MQKKLSIIIMATVFLSFALFTTHSFANEKTSKMMSMGTASKYDIEFVKKMIPHHKMAVDMVEKELKNGKNPEIREMAEKMKKDQIKEIENMQAWLDANQFKGNE